MKALIFSACTSIIMMVTCNSSRSLVGIQSELIKGDTLDNFGTPVNPLDDNETQDQSENNSDAKQEKDIGEIGDVKYSLLSEGNFQKENGYGWQLLSGQELGDKWDLTLKYQSELNHLKSGTQTKCHLPDARGIFLRGMNLDRQLGGNPDKPAMGIFQADTIESHNHGLGARNGTKENNDANLGGNRTYYQVSNSTVTDNAGGSETRPRNISLYIYVKVDHVKKAGKN